MKGFFAKANEKANQSNLGGVIDNFETSYIKAITPRIKSTEEFIDNKDP
jgi:hypothetical protein